MNSLRVFLDTEFLMGPEGPIFISAGFLTESSLELYAERPNNEVEALLRLYENDFVRDQVLSQFQRMQGVPWAELPRELAAWLDGLGADDIDMVYDNSHDYLLVEQLLAAHGASSRVRLHPTHVAYLLEDSDGSRAAESAWQALEFAKGLSRHHALADCYALRVRFDTVHPPVFRDRHQIVVVDVTVRAIINEFEYVMAETEDGELTVGIGEKTPGVAWRSLVVGQRLKCVVETNGSLRVVKAKVLP